MHTIEQDFGSPFLMQEVVAHAPQSILEIGAGIHHPSNVSDNLVYVGLNIDPRQHAQLTEEVGRNRFAVYFDLRKLTDEFTPGQTPTINFEELENFYNLFGNSRFDVLAFSNVFGEDPRPTHYRYTPSINPSGTDYRGYSSDRQKLLSLYFGLELLKPGGELVIQETKTPQQGLAELFQRNSQFLAKSGLTNIHVQPLATDLAHYVRDGAYVLTAKKL